MSTPLYSEIFLIDILSLCFNDEKQCDKRNISFVALISLHRRVITACYGEYITKAFEILILVRKLREDIRHISLTSSISHKKCSAKTYWRKLCVRFSSKSSREIFIIMKAHEPHVDNKTPRINTSNSNQCKTT